MDGSMLTGQAGSEGWRHICLVSDVIAIEIACFSLGAEELQIVNILKRGGGGGRDIQSLVGI